MKRDQKKPSIVQYNALFNEKEVKEDLLTTQGVIEYVTPHKNLIKIEYEKIVLKINEAKTALTAENLTKENISSALSILQELRRDLAVYRDNIVNSDQGFVLFVNKFSTDYEQCQHHKDELSNNDNEYLKNIRDDLSSLDSILRAANARRESDLVIEFYRKLNSVIHAKDEAKISKKSHCNIL